MSAVATKGKKRKAAEPAETPAPAHHQQEQFKAQYPGYVLLFRVGSFYEAYRDDAKTLSAVAGVKLTTSGDSEQVPMACVGRGAVEQYLKKLVAAGHKTALCEQTDDDAKGREVTRIVTPETLGTVQPPAAVEPVTPPAPPASPADAFAATFDRVELLAVLKGAAMLASERSFKPILSCVRLTADATGVTVEATNMQQAARWRLTQVRVETPGTACVRADKLLAVVAKQPDDTLRMGVEDIALVIRGRFRHVINRHNAAEWPASAEFPEAAGTVAGADLLRVIRQTLPCVAKSATRYAFNGVLLSCLPEKGNPSRILAAATDGRRLAAADCPAVFAKNLDRLPDAILPAAALDPLAKLVEPDDSVGVWWGENAAAFQGDNWALRTNLLEGMFPPYQDILPKGHDRRLTADAGGLVEAIEQASLLGDDPGAKSNDAAPKLVIELGPWGFRGRTEDRIGGTESHAPLDCRYEGPELEIGFHGPWLAQGVKAAEVPEGQEITLLFAERHRPVYVERPGYRFVLMPVNLQA